MEEVHCCTGTSILPEDCADLAEVVKTAFAEFHYLPFLLEEVEVVEEAKDFLLASLEVSGVALVNSQAERELDEGPRDLRSMECLELLALVDADFDGHSKEAEADPCSLLE